jgi:hypothetical protein
VRSTLVIAMAGLSAGIAVTVGIALARGHWAVLVVPAILVAGLLHERRKARRAGKKE